MIVTTSTGSTKGIRQPGFWVFVIPRRCASGIHDSGYGGVERYLLGHRPQGNKKERTRSEGVDADETSVG